MADVKVEGDIDAPLDEVWKVVSDFVGFPASQGLQVKSEGDGIGMTRTITMGPMEIVERLEAVDDDRHTTSYSIPNGGPVPVKDYFATIALSAAGDSTTHITWTSTFEPAGASEEDVTNLMGKTYGGGIKALKRHFAGG